MLPFKGEQQQEHKPYFKIIQDQRSLFVYGLLIANVNSYFASQDK